MVGTEWFEAFRQSEMEKPKEWEKIIATGDDDRRDSPKDTITNAAKKVAVLMPNWISEFVLALSVIVRKAGETDQEITLIVPDHLTTLSKLLSPLPVLPYSRKNNIQFLDSVAIVKEESFDKLYLLPHSFSSAWFGLKTGISRCRGISAEQRNHLLTEKVPSEVASKDVHLTSEYSVILETSFAEPLMWPGITIEPNENYRGSIVLCPGADKLSSRWAGFEDLVKMWPDQHFVILGDEEDFDIAKNIGKRLPHRVENLTGKTSYEDVLSIIAGASVVITNENGLMQIAGYIGTPVVGIFGSTSPIWKQPLGESVRLVTSLTAQCRFCNKRECVKKKHECISTINPQHIIGSALEIMRR